MIKFFIAFMISASASAFTVPSQDLVDQHVNLALKISEKEILNGKGKHSCNFAFIHDKSWTSTGNNREEAATRLQLYCIKKQCEALVEQVKQSIADILNLPDEDYRDLLEFSGKTPKQIEEALIERNNGIAKEKPVLGCTSSANFRVSAFDSCYSVPLECN